jgi:hypothetical protein
MEANEDSVDTNSVEYRLGFRRYKYIREKMETLLNKSYKRRIPLYTATIAILDCIEDEYEDADVSKLIEDIKDII